MVRQPISGCTVRIVFRQHTHNWYATWLDKCYKNVFSFHSNLFEFPSLILDVFHDKTKGIFPLLNDECTLKTPSTIFFSNSLKNGWSSFRKPSPISWETKENVFSIRHFTNDVKYSTVRQLSRTNCNVRFRSNQKTYYIWNM